VTGLFPAVLPAGVQPRKSRPVLIRTLC